MSPDEFARLYPVVFAWISETLAAHAIFLKRTRASDEQLHFHELIHVVQWRLMGPERFLKLYADGLEKFGYWDSPLERMAYSAASEFRRSKQGFDAQRLVLRELTQLGAL